MIKLIKMLFGSLSQEDKEKVLEILKVLIKAGAEGAVRGTVKK